MGTGKGGEGRLSIPFNIQAHHDTLEEERTHCSLCLEGRPRGLLKQFHSWERRHREEGERRKTDQCRFCRLERGHSPRSRRSDGCPLRSCRAASSRRCSSSIRSHLKSLFSPFPLTVTGMSICSESESLLTSTDIVSRPIRASVFAARIVVHTFVDV